MTALEGLLAEELTCARIATRAFCRRMVLVSAMLRYDRDLG